jgi:hypothetical protein
MSTSGGTRRSSSLTNARRIHDELRRAEDMIRHRADHEVIVGIDRFGNRVLTEQGVQHEIRGETSADLRGGVVTHNHPVETSLSIPDVLMAQSFDLAEMRVVTPAYTYSVRPPTRGWQHLDTTWHKSLEDALRASEGFWKSRLRQEALSGKMSEREALLSVQHHMMQSVAKEMGLRYRRIPR